MTKSPTNIEDIAEAADDDLIAPWAPKQARKARDRSPERTAERRKLKDESVALGKQVTIMRSVPARGDEIKPPKRGQMLKWAMSDEVKETGIPPMCRKLLCLLAAYADGGNESPTMRVLASRMAITMPEVMWLLRSLEIEGWIEVEWTLSYTTPNKYELIRRDGS